MRALVLNGPKDFSYEERPRPERGAGELLLRVGAVAVCGSDVHAVNGASALFSFPRVVGHEISADVIEADAGGAFRPGDRVCVMPTISCGECVACRKGKTNCCVRLKLYGVQADGGLQEYLALPERSVIRLPEGASHREGSLVEPFTIGAHALARIGVGAGDRALVLGSGPIGVCCALLARAAGAEATLAEVNAERAAFVKERFGLDALNPLDAGYEDAVRDITRGDLFNAVIDTTANKRSMDNAYRLIGNGGGIVFVGLHTGLLEMDEAAFHMKEPTLAVTRNSTRRDFEQVLALWAEGKIAPGELATDAVDFDGAARAIPAWASGEDPVFKGIVVF